MRSACSARSYEGMEQPANPTAARRSRPRWSRARLLDDLVHPQQDGLRDRKPERFGGLEVDHEFELRGLLDGQIAGPSALEDLVNKAPSSRSIHPSRTMSIGVKPLLIRRYVQGMPICLRDNLLCSRSGAGNQGVRGASRLPVAPRRAEEPAPCARGILAACCASGDTRHRQEPDTENCDA